MTPDIQELRRLAANLEEYVQLLAVTEMHMSMQTWNVISNDILKARSTILALIEENERLRIAMETAADAVKSIVDHYDWMMEGMPAISMANSAEIVARYQVNTRSIKSIADFAESDLRTALEGVKK